MHEKGLCSQLVQKTWIQDPSTPDKIHIGGILFKEKKNPDSFMETKTSITEENSLYPPFFGDPLKQKCFILKDVTSSGGFLSPRDSWGPGTLPGLFESYCGGDKCPSVVLALVLWAACSRREPSSTFSSKVVFLLPTMFLNSILLLGDTASPASGPLYRITLLSV